MSKTREERKAGRKRRIRIVVCILVLVFLLTAALGTKAESEDIHTSEEIVDNFCRGRSDDYVDAD